MELQERKLSYVCPIPGLWRTMPLNVFKSTFKLSLSNIDYFRITEGLKTCSLAKKGGWIVHDKLWAG